MYRWLWPGSPTARPAAMLASSSAMLISRSVFDGVMLGNTAAGSRWMIVLS
jgi:hypothetical protein